MILFNRFFLSHREGAPKEIKDKFMLGGADDYKEGYMSNGKVVVDSQPDAEEFKHTLVAMELMGINDFERNSILGTVAAICHMGNLRFEAVGEASAITNKDVLAKIAKCLECDAAQLDAALCKPRIKAGREIVQTALTKEKAEYSCRALAKAVYGRMFLWLIKKINLTLAQPTYHSFIGVLDIAGFEIFEHNSFEQMCINYTNERLQQFFNNHMFKLEQEEYMREQINWTFIDFGLDLQDTIDLIDKKPNGILCLLDEECFFPKGTDESFLNKLHQAHNRNAHFKKPKVSE